MADFDVSQFQEVDFSYFNDASTICNDEDDPPAYSNIEDSSPTSTYANSGAVTTNGFHGNKTEDSNNSSPLSSRSSNISSSKNADTTETTATATSATVLPENYIVNSDNSDTDSFQLNLRGGHQLQEESKTETSKSALYSFNNDTVSSKSKQPASMASSVISMSNGTGTAKARAAKSPYTSPSSDTIPVEEINIPNDANISSYTANQLSNFLRCFNVEDRIISHLHRKQVDGKRFSRLRDSELESLGMKNSVIVFFRDRSNVKASKKKQFFVL